MCVYGEAIHATLPRAPGTTAPPLPLRTWWWVTWGQCLNETDINVRRNSKRDSLRFDECSHLFQSKPVNPFKFTFNRLLLTELYRLKIFYFFVLFFTQSSRRLSSVRAFFVYILFHCCCDCYYYIKVICGECMPLRIHESPKQSHGVLWSDKNDFNDCPPRNSLPFFVHRHYWRRIH